MTKTRPLICNAPHTIAYHSALVANFGDFARGSGIPERKLREMTEEAIYRRSAEAFVEHPCHLGANGKPRFFTLLLTPSVGVYFSIENKVALIRGYGWDFDVEDTDDETGKFFH